MNSVAQFSWNDEREKYIVASSRSAPYEQNITFSSAEKIVAKSGEKILSLFSHSQDRKTIFIKNLSDPRLSLREGESLPIFVESWPQLFTACSHDIDEFAFAADEFETIEEIKASIVELYFSLKEDQNNLGPLPQKHWDFLKSVMQEN